MKLNVYHIIAQVSAASFGLGPVALNLSKEQNRLGVNAKIWCLDNEYELKWASEQSGLEKSKLRGFATTGPKKIGLSNEMERAARFERDKNLVIHQHCIWTGLSRVTSKMRCMHKIPTVLAPHGSLEKWALKKSWWKKQIALRLYEGRNLRNANCLHACSEQEVAGIRDYGLKNAIAVIPNGISDSWLSSSGSGDEFREQFKLPKEKRIMLFLSRITPIKGLPMLIEALNLIRQYLDNWLLVIAGSDEFGHKARVVEKIEELKLEEYVRFTGLLTGQTKRNAFAASEFFILPSKREAAPVVILEALGSGIPVLATHGAPWEDLIRFRCGWWTEACVESISEAVKEGIGNSPEKLSAMGRRGKELVSTNYTWTKSAKMTIELYKWLLDRRDRPDFIILN